MMSLLIFSEFEHQKHQNLQFVTKYFIMRLIFEKLRYCNFLSAGSGGVEISLNQIPTTLITGRNGSGKSSFIDALCYVLFNSSHRGVTLPSLINSINKKKMLVEVEFTIGTKKYLVRRGAKPSVFEIHVDGEQLQAEAANNDFQKYLETAILGMNFKTFCQLVIIGKASYVPFMKLSKATRLDKIEDFLDLRILTAMAEQVKSAIAVSKQTIKDIETELAIQKNKIDLQESLIKTLHDDNQRKIAENQSTIDGLLAKIETAQKYKSELEERQKGLLDQIADRSSVKESRQKWVDLNSKLKLNKNQLGQDLLFFKDNCECPTCTQVIEEDFKEKIVSEKQLKFNELDGAIDKMALKIGELDERLEEIHGVTVNIESYRFDIQELQSEINSDSRYVQKLQNEIAEWSSSNGSVEIEKEKLRQYGAEALKISEKKLEALEERQYLDTCAALLKDNGIKAEVVEKYLPIINKLVAKYLDELEFFTTFELDSSFSESIKSRDRDEFTYSSFSQGEQAKIDMALLFTFIKITQIKNTVSCNILVFDETLDGSLDTITSSLIVDIVKNDLVGKNVYVITHYPHLYEDAFDNQLSFAKQGNYSVIEE